LFAGDLNGAKTRISKLGLTYLHLMPLFRCRGSEHGNMQSDYRRSTLAGNMKQLTSLAKDFRPGINLVLDLSSITHR
jgi:hypothetical protein